MSPSVISLIGILSGMVILVFLAFKGYNVIIVSVIAALVVAVFAGTDILPLITDSYMTKFADFAKNNFMIFLLSAVFGKLMGDSGAADTIAYSMLRVVNHVHSQRTKQLVGGLMITAIVAVLTYGGVSLFVVIFTLISIGRKLFEELDIPWRHYLTFHGIGSATFTMTMLPGTAALQNIIPTQYLGTTPMAGAAIGLTGAAIQILLCVLWAAFILKRARARGEGFRPSGEAVKAAYRDEDEKKAAAGESQVGIPLLLALIPPVVLLLVLNVCKLHAVIALSCGILVCLILFGLILRRLDNLKATLAAGAVNSISTIGTTCAVVGFGGVVAAVSGYQLILGSLTSIPGPAIFKLIIAVNVAAGLTGSSSGGLSIALENMQDYFLGLGLSPNVIHRIGAMSSGGLDSMPHVSGFVNNLQVCRLNHRQSYVYNEDGTGELTGFEVDIAKEICSRLGVEPDFQISSSWDPVEAGMDSGRYDCIICGVNPKPERQEKYNMSIAYAENPFCLVVAGDNEEITSFADLAGKSCANALNSTAGDLARKAGAELSDASLTAAMDLIVSGRADATVNNVAAVEEYMKERPDMNVKIAAIYEPEEGEEWIIQSAVAFQKGADTLTEKVNEILQEMIDDGTCYDLTVQYFGQSVADSTSIYQK